MLRAVFERFTERARGVVVHAQQQSRSLKHNYIGTAHLLLLTILAKLACRLASERAFAGRCVAE